MSYRAFWKRRCRAAAAGAVLKPQGGNCAVLPKEKRIMAVDRGAERRSEILGFLRFNTRVVERENGAHL